MPFLALFILPFLLALVISISSTPAFIRLAWKLGIVDDPKRHIHPKVVHTYPVPRAGGLPIYLAILVGIPFFLPTDSRMLGVAIGASLAVLVGLLDDRWDLNPYIRLPLNLLTALPLIVYGINLSFITNPLGGLLYFQPWQSNLLTLFWVGGMMNFIGMGAGGVEGQHPGVITITATTLALLSLRYIQDPSQWSTIILAGLTAGAYLGFLPWNFFPQKIMPGYSGKSLAGFLLATIAILAPAKLATLLLILVVPMADVGWVFVRRILSGRSPVWGDKGHLHHRLLELGWSKKRIAIFYWILTATCGGLALLLNSAQKFYTLAAVFLTIGAIVLWLSYWTSSKASGRDSGSKT